MKFSDLNIMLPTTTHMEVSARIKYTFAWGWTECSDLHSKVLLPTTIHGMECQVETNFCARKCMKCYDPPSKTILPEPTR